MKRLAATFFVLVMVMAALCGPVYAASNTYELDELGLKVTIPSGYSVVTRDTPTNAQVFSDLGLKGSEVLSYFEANSIYLNAISDSYDEEIVVTMTDNGLTNFNLLSDSVLETLISTISTQYADYGMELIKHEIYRHSQAKFIKVYFTDTN